MKPGDFARAISNVGGSTTIGNVEQHVVTSMVVGDEALIVCVVEMNDDGKRVPPNYLRKRYVELLLLVNGVVAWFPTTPLLVLDSARNFDIIPT